MSIFQYHDDALKGFSMLLIVHTFRYSKIASNDMNSTDTYSVFLISPWPVTLFAHKFCINYGRETI